MCVRLRYRTEARLWSPAGPRQSGNVLQPKPQKDWRALVPLFVSVSSNAVVIKIVYKTRQKPSLIYHTYKKSWIGKSHVYQQSRTRKTSLEKTTVSQKITTHIFFFYLVQHLRAQDPSLGSRRTGSQSKLGGPNTGNSNQPRPKTRLPGAESAHRFRFCIITKMCLTRNSGTRFLHPPYQQLFVPVSTPWS